MKKFFLAAMFAALAIPCSAQADILLTGIDTFTTLNTTNGGPDTLAANVNIAGVTGSVLFPGQAGLNNVWLASGVPNNTTGNFGTTYSGASVIGNVVGDEGAYGNPTATNTDPTLSTRIEYTITNNTGSDLDLNTFHFDGAMGAGTAGRTWQLDTIAGSVTLANIVAPTAFGTFNALSEIDQSLAGLADRTIANGEFATFRLAFSGNSTGGNGIRLDNVGIGGLSAVPEPSSLAILGLVGVGMLVRRKK